MTPARLRAALGDHLVAVKRRAASSQKISLPALVAVCLWLMAGTLVIRIIKATQHDTR
jgi:hypothetical protein